MFPRTTLILFVVSLFGFVVSGEWTEEARADGLIKAVTKESEVIVGELQSEDDSTITVLRLGQKQPSKIARNRIALLRGNISESEALQTVGLPNFVVWKMVTHGITDKPIAVMAPLDEEGHVASGGTRIAEDLTTQLAESGMKLVERRLLAQVQRELDLQQTKDFDQAAAVALGKRVGAQVILVGSILPRNRYEELRIRAIDVGTGNILFGVLKNLPQRNLPANPSGSITPQPSDGSKLGPTPRTITNSLGMQLVFIPKGAFEMGSSVEQIFNELQELTDRGLVCHHWHVGRLPAEVPKHTVEITRAFYLGQHEVTVGQFGRFVEDAEYVTDAERSKEGARGFALEKQKFQYGDFSWKEPGFAQGKDHPVVCLSWNDADAFCKWLSKKEGKAYRLPTEAEWERACRAGTTTRFSTGNAIESLRGFANLADESFRKVQATFRNEKYYVPWDDGFPFTAPVGSFKPNSFGLYDMHGNCFEWCLDWHHKSFYLASPVQDPTGPPAGEYRINRGSCFYHFAQCARSSYRGFHPPDSVHDLCGFRVVLER